MLVSYQRVAYQLSAISVSRISYQLSAISAIRTLLEVLAYGHAWPKANGLLLNA
ncbi:hypothetical protein [Moorena sp. SIO2C4]|uniref:hypothetical protein n=1 Tax=Moorena sp. SIO2C4 TaxID=2607824 RepID=UPI00257AA757|nr:hypothetical protein [Moorena sp. SIO2C4]